MSDSHMYYTLFGFAFVTERNDFLRCVIFFMPFCSVRLISSEQQCILEAKEDGY